MSDDPISIIGLQQVTGLTVEDLVTRMMRNPRHLIESLAADPRFAHLGREAPDKIARAFGFASLDDVDVQWAAFRRMHG